MIYAENTDCRWGTSKFYAAVGNKIEYPQIFVAEYPFSDKWFFEIATTVIVTKGTPLIEALPGSFIDGKTGKTFERGISIPVDFIRLPTFEELRYYEWHSKL